MIHFKQSIVSTYLNKYLVKMFTIGVGNEYLTKHIVGTHHLHNLLHPVGIKLVEYIVE